MNFVDQVILLVEDEEYLAKMYKVEFELNDFKVVIAKDGEEGFAQAASLHPSLIVSDIIIPKVDGLTMLKRLKEDARTKQIPVIILTNYGEQKNMKDAFSLGAADFVIKYMVTPREVVDKIKTILGKAQQPSPEPLVTG